MENKNDKEEQNINLSENQYEKDPPVEFIERTKSSDETSSTDEVKYADLEKFKRGELGASYIGYNDDGSPHGSSRKFNKDADNTDLK